MSLQLDKGVRTTQNIPEHGSQSIELGGQWVEHRKGCNFSGNSRALGV